MSYLSTRISFRHLGFPIPSPERLGKACPCVAPPNDPGAREQAALWKGQVGNLNQHGYPAIHPALVTGSAQMHFGATSLHTDPHSSHVHRHYNSVSCQIPRACHGVQQKSCRNYLDWYEPIWEKNSRYGNQWCEIGILARGLGTVCASVQIVTVAQWKGCQQTNRSCSVKYVPTKDIILCYNSYTITYNWSTALIY